MPLHVAVEGGAGVGKTTLLPKLINAFAARNLVLELVPEPVDKWVAWEGKNDKQWNLLELMYQDPKEYAYRFQMVAATTKIESLDYADECRLVERSLASQEHVFIPHLVEGGHLNELDQSLLAHFFETVRDYDGLEPDVIIYLRTSPEIALERVRSRAREGEETVTLEWLTTLHRLYDQWLVGQKNVIEVDVSDFSKVDPVEIADRVLDYWM